jgi:type II secretory ATPase GspE/PulE/Tfp pilus assembly ATPase PilB-like protein
VGGVKYDLRVSILLTSHGEKAVIRVFNKESRITDFAGLGFSPDDETAIKKMLSSAYGIVYLGGPTGSGKTTTLYAMIEHKNSDKINIYTIEDPVEKTIPGVNQIQVEPKTGVGYPEILRALLRQDPDILVVGEIRDQETADLSVRSSLTGHLVLSTVHANNALDIINRLYNMSVEPYLLSATALGFISQRLVRVLCPRCKQEVKPSPPEIIWLEQLSSVYGVDTNKTFYGPMGCPACNNIGYKGRLAVAEVLSVTSREQKECLAARDIISLCDTSLKNGFAPLDLAGFLKASSGSTSVREVMRVLNSPLL